MGENQTPIHDYPPAHASPRAKQVILITLSQTTPSPIFGPIGAAAAPPVHPRAPSTSPRATSDLRYDARTAWDGGGRSRRGGKGVYARFEIEVRNEGCGRPNSATAPLGSTEASQYYDWLASGPHHITGVAAISGRVTRRNR